MHKVGKGRLYIGGQTANEALASLGVRTILSSPNRNPTRT